jgi:acetolactate synthase-1/2/3 large subunit
MKAADLFVKALEAEGVEYIFGIPGEENLDLLNALKDSRITFILTRHEQAAGFMAATYGRLTGKAGVCLSTLGPGATNLVTAAAYAQLGAMPMLMITGQKPIKHSKQGQFQIIDVVNMMQPLTKSTRQVASGDHIPARVREAFRMAQEERPGATHLEFPEDIAAEETSARLIPVSYTRRPTADLILNVGHDVVEKPPFFMDHQNTQVIHVNFFSAQVDAVYFPQLEVVGDIANSLWQIKERILKQGRWDFTYFQQVQAAAAEYNRQGSSDPRFPIHPRRLVADVRAVMPANGIVALDNGIYKIWFARNYPAYEPNTLLLDNALATMGAGLPSAIAARLVYPEHKVLAVCGDGGFMMNSQELETAVRLRLNLVILVLRDDSYGMIKWKQDNLGFTSFGLNFGNPDFVKYAESYGAQGHRVTTAVALRPLLEYCLHTPGLHLIECPVDYSENDRILNHEIRDQSLNWLA